MKYSLQAHEKWFEQYVANKISGSSRDTAPMYLKLKHTNKVLENAKAITAEENFSPNLARLCQIAALYHDVSRFNQYLVYGTFKDKDSLNHGLASLKILKGEKRLEQETTADRHLVYTAVAMHNRFRLPQGLTGELKIACDLVRSADKLDILRVMEEHLSSGGPYNPTIILSLPDDPALCGQKVIDSIMAGNIPSYNDLRSVNDFRLLLGSWFLDLPFASARRIFLDSGHAQRLVESVPDNNLYGKAKNILLKRFAAAEKTT